MGEKMKHRYRGFAEWFETVSISRNPYTNTTETSSLCREQLGLRTPIGFRVAR